MAAQVSLAQRTLVTVVLTAILVGAYAAVALVGLAPLPQSLRTLAAEQRVGRGYAFVSGYYVVVQPFEALGSGLPPYELTGDLAGRSPHVRVKPDLSDLRPGRVAALVDKATGDGTDLAPYAVKTIGLWDRFVDVAVASGLVGLALLFWLSGYAATMLGRR